jgi:hypothetical protein
MHRIGEDTQSNTYEKLVGPWCRMRAGSSHLLRTVVRRVAPTELPPGRWCGVMARPGASTRLRSERSVGCGVSGGPARGRCSQR